MVSVTSHFREPKEDIPFLIPLLNSKSKTVKELFIAKLEHYCEEYGELLINVLDESLDLVNPSNIELLNGLKAFLNRFNQGVIQVKQGVKELDPYYVHSRYIHQYTKSFHKNFIKGLEMSRDENSFFGQIPTTVVAKGGGYSLGADRGISKLSKFESSFALPRSYYINPVAYELFEYQEVRKDWAEDYFNVIEELISKDE